MSKIQELLEKLCPNGVEFRNLGSIAEIKRGERVTKAELKTDGEHPVISGGVKPLGYFDKFNRESETITIAQYGSAGYIDWQSQKFWANDVCYSIFPKEVNNRYLYHYLINSQDNIYALKTNAIPAHLPQDKLSVVEIPTPPIEIQIEIVKTLDLFTAMEAELKAELESRRTQYAYYKDVFYISKGKDVQWKAMGDIGHFTRGKRFVKTDMVAEGIPCIHYGEMYTHYNVWATEAKSFLEPELAARLRVAKTGDVIIVAAGETIEDIGLGVAWLGEDDIVIHDACFAYSHDMHPNYVSHFLQTDLFHSQIKRYISSGKISAINAAGLSKAKIPVPPIEEQQRIASILDKFHTLINDISIGIPAEIEWRRKQYEHYRNQLLTFKNANHG
jgi:type I restriction enzyme S subunit